MEIGQRAGVKISSRPPSGIRCAVTRLVALVVDVLAGLFVGALVGVFVGLFGAGFVGVGPCIAQRTAPASPKPPAPNVSRIPPEAVQRALDRLRALGYWCDTSYNTGSAANKQAIVAFQKIEHLTRSGKLDDRTLARIATAPRARCTDSIGLRHYEIDLNAQVLLIVDSSNEVARILPVSTGSGKWFSTPKNGGRYARTPRGRFKVFYKVAGWRKSELGELYYPLYVRGGVAIHGAPSVPARPASHGCIRIPMFAAKQLFDITPIGTIVIVYGENPSQLRIKS